MYRLVPCVLLLLCSACGSSEPPAVPAAPAALAIPDADTAKVVALEAAQPLDNLPFYQLSFDDARIKAHAEDKLVFLDFYTTWCRPCKLLDKETFADEKVRAWMLERLVPLKIDAEKQTALAQRYRVGVFPTLVFVRADGTEVGRFAGFRPPDMFLKQAAAITTEDQGA